MEQVVLFDQPLRFEYVSGGKEKAYNESPVFGFVLPDVYYDQPELVEYVEYLVGAQKWYAIGNDVRHNTWTSKDGNRYHTLDTEIKAFIEQANKEHRVSASLYETRFVLNRRKGVVNGFIADADLARRIREEGQMLDVLTSQSE